MIQTDICIVGAGPVGLFAVFEAGLLKMQCHVVDALPQVGGQLTEIYPKKPIYDIPGYPSVLAGDLIKNLEEQIAPFKPTFTLGERVETLEKLEDGSFHIVTSDGTDIKAKAVVIAGGGDSALDWTVFLAEVAAELSLVHRRDQFRGAPDTAAKVQELADAGKINLYYNTEAKALSGNGHLNAITLNQ